MKRLLVCGDREWTDRARIRVALLRARTKDYRVVIHGACRGADRLAGEEAMDLGFEVIPFPADWIARGRVAGPMRNERMLREGAPDAVVAFHRNIAASRGTADMVARARAAGLPVYVIDR